jgi:hypothetical protein
MPHHSASLISLCTLTFAAIGAAQDASKPQLTARELFYSAVQAPAAAPAAKNTPTKPTQTAKTTPRPAKPAAPPKVEVAHSNPRPGASSSAPVSVPGGQVIAASDVHRETAPAPTAGPALGLKYSILKWQDGQQAEVPPDTVFHAGDRIQIRVQTNGPGYLYIISQGSSGTWKPMFPSSEVEDGNNHVEGLRDYAMPPKSRLVFDEQAGTEKLFVVFSRAPEPDLENVIYSLRSGKPAPASAPKTEDRPKPKTMVEVAQLNINDATVGRLRTTYARDLIIEPVTPDTPGDRKETAVYVVNPTGSDDSRVVADIQLVHQ